MLEVLWRIWEAAEQPCGVRLVALLPLWLPNYEAEHGRLDKATRKMVLSISGSQAERRATTRLMHWVCALCRHLPLSEVRAFCGISTTTAYRWDKEVLRRVLPEPCLEGIEVLLIDEKAVRKGHGYVTLAMNGQTGER